MRYPLTLYGDHMGITINRNTESVIDDGKTFQIGYATAAAGAGVIDFDTLNDTLYGYQTTRQIEIVAVEHIIVETHVCDATAGVASLQYGTTVVATVTGVNDEAANSHISGVLAANPIVPAGSMLFMKVTTQSDDSGAQAGEGYFIVTYK